MTLFDPIHFPFFSMEIVTYTFFIYISFVNYITFYFNIITLYHFESLVVIFRAATSSRF